MSFDIFHWRENYPSNCPNCHTPWSHIPPEGNLVPHWTGECVNLGWLKEPVIEDGIARHWREEEEKANEYIANGGLRHEAELQRIQEGLARAAAQDDERARRIRRTKGKRGGK